MEDGAPHVAATEQVPCWKKKSIFIVTGQKKSLGNKGSLFLTLYLFLVHKHGMEEDDI